MDYQQYLKRFEEIIDARHPQQPYDDSHYLGYAKLNYARIYRWWRTPTLNDDLVSELKKIDRQQQWIIIVEPWCGDAAPVHPFLVRLAAQNPGIRYDIHLRDQEPFLINSYLTNGAKSIPKLIVRDSAGSDLFTWGPRPKPAQQLVDELKAAHVDAYRLHTALQNWYNQDKGSELQRELLQLFRSLQRQQAVGLAAIK